jgi:phosphoglycerate dehydrogenase-like enzyme
VDEPALVHALETGHLAAAGLDVFTNEPLPAGHRLGGLKNVVAAPHVAWLTRETLERSVEAARRNVERLRAGLPLENRVA